MSGFDANGSAEYDRFIAGPLCRAIDSVAFARSSNEASPLSGVLLTYGEQFFSVSATDGVRSATKKYGEGDEPGGAVKVVVPADLVDALATNFDDDEELRVELRSSADDPVLHLEGDDFLMVQPLWPLNHYRDALGADADRDPTNTLVIRQPEFTQLLGTVAGDEAIFALTPESLIVRTAEGLVGEPLSADVYGRPARVQVDPGWLQAGAEFVDAPFQPEGAIEICVDSEGDTISLVRASRGDDGVAATYCQKLGASLETSLEWGDASAARFDPLGPQTIYPRQANGGRPSAEEIIEQLESFVGQEAVKTQVRRLRAQVELNKFREEAGLKGAQPAAHMVFTGPAGTGKTTVARLIAQLYHALGVLPTDTVKEVDRSALVAAHIGGTEEKTAAAIEEAMGGVLFVDEAYALAGGGTNDFGRQAIETLLKALEDRRGEFVCIVAGYTKEMEGFLKANPGMTSRFNRTLAFEPYSADELAEISSQIAEQSDNILDESAAAALRVRLEQEESAGGFESTEWGNARTIRNVLDSAIAHRDLRVSELESFDIDTVRTLTETDIEAACDDYSIGRSADGHGGGDVEQENVEDVLADLNAQVGQPQLKHQIQLLIASSQAAKLRSEQGIASSQPPLPHLMFLGPPGTGKTTVARLIARLYKALGLLPSGHVVEVDQSSLVAGYLGQTALKTSAKIDEALGGVLFIDEAYTLANGSSKGFGHEAVSTLLKRMSDDQGKFLVIAAGYSDAMTEFLEMNDGLSRRFPTKIEFAPYTSKELAEIADVMAATRNESLTENARALLADQLENAEKMGLFETADWGNAGFVQNVLDRAAVLRDLRIFDSGEALEPEDLTTITANDLDLALSEFLPEEVGGTPEETAESVEEILAELNAQVGQTAVKEQIRVLLAGVRAQQARREAGLSSADVPLSHLVFTGPPGTGKTTVARLLARLYKALGLLSRDTVVEVGRADLVGQYIGHTAAATKKQIEKAMGGVLFIDEAYTLASGESRDFGTEAIDTLLTHMENDRGKFVVIAAGYSDEMETFLNSNPGLPSRFATTIEFQPYTPAELTEIAVVMAESRGDTFSEEALETLAQRLVLAERHGVFDTDEWGNARVIRNVLDKASNVRNTRLHPDEAARPSAAEMTVIVRADIEPACEACGLGALGERQHRAADDSAKPVRSIAPPRWRKYDSDEELREVQAGIKAEVGKAARALAPGVQPGTAAPVCSELAQLGLAELYWQGGTSMGFQIRFQPWKKDYLYYFAGGSNGLLPDVANFSGENVNPEHERDLTDRYPLRTLEEWQSSDLDLAEHILRVIKEDHRENS